MTEQEYLDYLMERYPKLTPIRDDIARVYEMMKDAYASGHKLLVAGNGGSAADSEHIAGELMKGFVKPRALPEEMVTRLKAVDAESGACLAENLQGALPSLALTGQPGLATAVLNDLDGRFVYAQLLYGYGQEGDVFLAITTSGNSENIYLACVAAKAKGLKVIALTGKTGGKVARLADASIIVPENETFKIQELHLPIYHALCLMLEEHFF